MKRWRWLIVPLVVGLLSVGALWWFSRRPPALRQMPQVAGRLDGTATLLADGTILVVGGRVLGQGSTAIAERYDPHTGLWQDAGRLRTARTKHTASLLPDGSVVIVGGVGGGLWPWQRDGITTVERYQPARNRWTTLAPLPQGVTEHSAVVLSDGRLLVVGGRDRDAVPSQATVAVWAYTPTTNRWQALASLHQPRDGNVATLLPDGWVLLVGGVDILYPSQEPSAEVYDPQQDRWQPGPILGVTFAGYQRAARLADGRVLVADGVDVFLYDPALDRWSRRAPGARLAIAGSLSTLHDGRVLQVAGSIQAFYDPAADRWQIAQRAIYRAFHTATLLPDGRVVLLGGQSVDNVGPGHDVEFIQP